jgi:hypothetical protein
MVLQRHLSTHGEYQCVDLAKVGANAADLLATSGAAPHLGPSVVVSLAGNNWMLSPPMSASGPGDGAGGCAGSGAMDADEGVAEAFAAGLRAGGYPGMRRAFTAAVLPEIHAYVERLVRARRATGARVVMVIPEFDLTGFVSPAELEVPVLEFESLRRWHALRAMAQAALADTRPEAVAGPAAEMAELDGGCSPVPGRLAGLAAVALGDGAAARAAFERSRDSVMGLLVRETPRVTRSVQDTLVAAAAEHGFACVDLRRVLARTDDLPELPDEACFHDYCHLSDLGIERAMAAVADAVLGVEPGTTAAGPGAPALVRAFGHARGAAHLAFQGQPAATITRHLRAALDAEPDLAGLLCDVRDVLAARRPAWAHPAAERLSADPQVRQFVPMLAGTDGLCTGLWTLRACLDDLLGPSAVGPNRADRIQVGPNRSDRDRADRVPAGQAAADELDLLAAPTTDGHPLPNWTPARDHHMACSSVSVLAFALTRPARGTLTLTYRTRHAPPGSTLALTCNDIELTELPAAPAWTSVEQRLPARATRPGVNWLRVHWPIPDQDVELAHRDDAEALDRREFPQVLPVFGELHELRLHLDA